MDIFEGLSERQREAVETIDDDLEIIACAGAGKTGVVTRRIVNILKSNPGVLPENIVAFTFTKKAAEELKGRINAYGKSVLGHTKGFAHMYVGTIHGFCIRMLQDYIPEFQKFTVLDEIQTKLFVERYYEECGMQDLELKKYVETSLFISVMSVLNENWFEQDKWDEKTRIAFEKYRNKMYEEKKFDYSLILREMINQLETNCEFAEVIKNKVKYLTVDEYQDTNPIQEKLIEILKGFGANICVVGDDDQSIYKFRGANIYNILNFEKEFPNAVTIKLEQNYRSTQNILNAANGVIANNVGRKAKRLWTENEEGEKIAFHQFETGFDEADYVAKDIRSKVREGMYHYGDCAVLYRTNAQSRLFEERFITASIPYKIVGGVNFYSRREIKDLLAYLKTIDNAMDDLAVRRIINVPKRGIGATTLSRVQDYADENGLTFYNALKMAEEIGTIGRASAKIRPFVMLIQSMRSKLPYISVSELLQEIIEETGYVRELEAENTEEAQQRMENIDELISKAVTYEESEEEPTLSGFLEEVALVADIDSVDETQDYVVLMTLHSAKGLEFPQVYLAGMEDGLFPGFGAICAENPTAEIEEERRLAYVGITRAKERLSISCARMRMIRGETQYNKVSRFVKEIPRELLAGTIQKEKMPDIPKPSMMAKNAFSAKPMALRRTGVPEARNFGNSAMKKLLDYAVGDTVSHLKFGTGVVKQIIDGGRDYEVTVDFSGVGVKKMFASFAKLKKL